jgi:DnaJ-class molecular chaperone
LNLAETADDEDIKAAYKRLAKRYHPDRAPEGERDAASRKLRELNLAYEWLMHRRKAA